MKIEIELFHNQRWCLAATFDIRENVLQGYKGSGVLCYDLNYALEHLGQTGLTALSCSYPVNFVFNNCATWPAFLLDLLPTGAGRRSLLAALNLRDEGPKSDWMLLSQCAGNPPGNLRVKQAAERYQHQSGRSFSKEDIIERAEDFIEYAYGALAPVAGSSDIQGDAPKFLLTLDKNDRWHADGLLADQEAKAHYIVKFPRGRKASDLAVLKNEAAYYRVAQVCGLRVHSLPEWINNTLFIPRFDRVVQGDQVLRYGQESLCSLAGVADFGVVFKHEDLCAAFLPHVTDPQAELLEYLKRDILNIVLGNTDNHARNTALGKYPDQRIALTPLFDFAPMILDDEGIARSARWRDGEEFSEPNWRIIIKNLSLQFKHLPINFKEISVALLIFSEKLVKLPDILVEANVDDFLVQRLIPRIKVAVQALQELE